jgi:hypothetical protein
MKFKVGKLLDGRIVEILGEDERGISVMYHVINHTHACEQSKRIPLNTKFVWVREYSFWGSVNES